MDLLCMPTEEHTYCTERKLPFSQPTASNIPSPHAAAASTTVSKEKIYPHSKEIVIKVAMLGPDFLVFKLQLLL